MTSNTPTCDLHGKFDCLICAAAADPTGTLPGVKHDQGKPRWSLLPWGAVRQVVEVLTYGARKYAPGNWLKVTDARERYHDAAQRHIIAWFEGEKLDPETHLPHLAHAVCCLLFLAARDDLGTL